MRLRFAVSGQAATVGVKEQASESQAQPSETKAPEPQTSGAAETTNSEAKIKAATGN